ncbi:flavin monoamine oxidase family protein [Alkalihalobacterium chitinilyticum]|uniref:FAD-dependent oxidoreductase n=1 Tax=Alkalihalobacterium chitinilyticum TaxID=2980103 RepID=A0ABT5VGC3_9BACI|nr:FAD-dependent oxidoreductase [Alkalihalobacterium chitinilyticum]MDE5414506.1 FAD-dependent oxidoreductase [Alkalihalobacterium chitinilyticum]
MANSHNEVNVVIIGAGLSGLTAAFELKKQDISFTILEARDRAGGRIYSLKEDHFGLDLGAQWISTHHEKMKRLIAEYDLETISTSQKGKTIYEQRGRVKEVNGFLPPVSRLALMDLFKVKRKINHMIKQLPDEAPWNSELGQSLDQITMQDFVNASMFTDEGKIHFTLLAEEELSTKMYNVSALDVFWFLKSAGSVNKLLSAEQYWIREGASSLVESMAERLEDYIEYNRPVEEVKYDSYNEAVVSSGEKQWKAKKVIITVPPNITGNIKFDPELPKARTALQKESDFPFVMKMVVVYDKPFWREAGLNGSLFSDQGPISLTMDSSPKDQRFGVLTILIGGENAQIYSKMGQEYRRNETIKTLVRFFGEKAGTPIQVYEKDWSEDKWTRGGYGSHFPPGTLTKYGNALTEPVGPIHWAGSETATKWRLYMEGAVQSGQRAAEEVWHDLHSKQ